MVDFVTYRKIPRWSREVVITEKIDGTNGVIHFDEDGIMSVGSRSRWLEGSNDNHGFAKWAREHEEELYEGHIWQRVYFLEGEIGNIFHAGPSVRVRGSYNGL